MDRTWARKENSIWMMRKEKPNKMMRMVKMATTTGKVVAKKIAVDCKSKNPTTSYPTNKQMHIETLY